MFLLEECQRPVERGVLRLLSERKIDEAATEYARYVLDVRDGFDICNAQIRALRKYADDMSANTD